MLRLSLAKSSPYGKVVASCLSMLYNWYANEDQWSLLMVLWKQDLLLQLMAQKFRVENKTLYSHLCHGHFFDQRFNQMTACLRRKNLQFHLIFCRDAHNYILISIIVHSRFLSITLIFAFIGKRFISDCFTVCHKLVKV